MNCINNRRNQIRNDGISFIMYIHVLWYDAQNFVYLYKHINSVPTCYTHVNIIINKYVLNWHWICQSFVNSDHISGEFDLRRQYNHKSNYYETFWFCAKNIITPFTYIHTHILLSSDRKLSRNKIYYRGGVSSSAFLLQYAGYWYWYNYFFFICNRFLCKYQNEIWVLQTKYQTVKTIWDILLSLKEAKVHSQHFIAFECWNNAPIWYKSFWDMPNFWIQCEFRLTFFFDIENCLRVMKNLIVWFRKKKRINQVMSSNNKNVYQPTSYIDRRCSTDLPFCHVINGVCQCVSEIEKYWKSYFTPTDVCMCVMFTIQVKWKIFYEVSHSRIQGTR